jgi:hypothetical protein
LYFIDRGHKLLTKAGYAVSNVMTVRLCGTGLILIVGLMTVKLQKDLMQEIVLTLGYRLKVPRVNLLDALEGSMSEILRFELKALLDMIVHLDEMIASF